MKKNYIISSAIILSLVLLTVTNATQAQNIGINANGAAPDAGAMLDISSTNKGLLIPRVNITNLNNIAPITGSATVSMLVYNTNATTGQGYYYWNGTTWVRLSTDGEDWKITGNNNTTSGTHFLGTTNAQALDFRTGNVMRLRLANGHQLQANGDGSAATPFYSWVADPGIGMYRIQTNTLGFSTSGVERLRIAANGNVGIGVAPTQRLHVAGGNFRLDGAFMPGNQAGAANQMLLSGGAGVAPQWSNFTFLNNPATTAIGKFFSVLSWTGNWNNNTYLTFIINDPNLVCNASFSSAVFVSFDCANNNALMAGFRIRNVKINAGNMAITVENISGASVSGGIPITYVAFY